MSLQNKIEQAREQARSEQTIAVCEWFEAALLESPKRAAAIMQKVQEKATKQREAKR